MSTVECIDLSKRYGKNVTALHNLNLQINEKTSFGLLGENGAGKSTLVKLLMGFIFPTSGQIRVLGEDDVARAHKRIGYVHERPVFETRFSGTAYLTYLGKLAGLWGTANRTQVNEVLAQVNLQDAADRPVGTYSKGMQQRLAIANALMTNPDFLILDEPTSGLDPGSQWEIRQIIAGLRKQGKTILLCSHYLTEVEMLCDAVGILKHGELILGGTVTNLLHAQDTVKIVLANNQSARDVVTQLHINEQVIESRANTLRIAANCQQAVLSRLINANVSIISLNPLSQTLEDVYVQTTRAVHTATLVTPSGTDELGKR